jgi:hypothetical protein
VSGCLFANVATYCQTLKVRFDAVSDFDTKRQFLLEFVSKVTYARPDKSATKIKVFGTLPVQIEINGVTEIVQIEFRIDKTLDWHEFMARVPKDTHDNEEYWRVPTSYCTPELLAAGRREAKL